MSTLSGIASKGEKGKSKFQSLNINSLYKGESLEPSQQKSAVPRCKYGMQSLGKVPSARRPPANLPSLKSESSGSEPAVSLVPTGGAGWGNMPGESQPPTQTQTNSSATANTTQPNSHVHTTSTTSTAAVLPTSSASLTSNHEQTSTLPQQSSHTTGDKSWSSVMAGEGGHPPSFLAHQSPFFQQEFPKLSSGDGQAVQIGQKGGSDTQYGPGPSLRPQTEGSWIQGGSRPQAGGAGGTSGSPTASLAQAPLPHHPGGVDAAGGRSNLGPHPPPGVAMGPGGPGIPANGPPMHGPPLHMPPGASQFRAMSVPFIFRGNFPAPPGAFAPNFQAGMGPPRQRFAGNYLPDGRFVGRSVDGEEIVTRPIIKEEELNHMDDIARDSSWARPDEIDYNQKIVFSDNEDNAQDDEVQTRHEEKRDRDGNDNDKEREDRDRDRDRERERDRGRDRERERERERDRDQDRDRDRMQDDRPDKRLPESGSTRTWQTHNYSRLNYTPTALRPQSSASSNRDRDNEDEIWKEKKRRQEESFALSKERAKLRKEEEEKRFEGMRRGAAKRLQMLDEKKNKSQISESKDHDDAATPVIPFPDWADKNRQSDRDREKSRSSNDGPDEKSRHNGSDFRHATQLDRPPFSRSDKDTRPREDRGKRDYDDKDSIKSTHRPDRSRNDERDRNVRPSERSGDGAQNYTKMFQNNLPPRFLKQQAERNQSAVSSNNNYMRSTGSPQPSGQSSSSNTFDPHWNHSNNSFMGQPSGGSRMPPRRYNSESSESNNDKPRNERDEDWDRFKHNRDNRNYGPKHLYHEVDHNRPYYDKRVRDLDVERSSEDNWERDRERDKERDRGRERDWERERDRERDLERDWDRERDRDRDSVPRERHLDDRMKDDGLYDEDRDQRRRVIKDRKSEERESPEQEEDRERDLSRKDDKRDERRTERPQRPDSRDSRTSRDSRNSRDSMRDDKSDVDHKLQGRGFPGSWSESHFKDDKKKLGLGDRDRKDPHGSQRHLPGPPITREKLEAAERNDPKRSLTQLKRFSDKKSEEKEVWGNQASKEMSPSEQWSDVVAEVEEPKKVNDEKTKAPTSEKKDPVKTEVMKQESPEKLKCEAKENKEMKYERKEEEREKREKSEKSGKVRGSRGRTESGRGRQGLFYTAYRNNHGSRGERRRRDSGRLSGRNRADNRDWNQGSESEGSGDEVSASTESGKEDKKVDSARSSKSRVQLKKVEKDERNKETRKSESSDSKSNFQSGGGGPRFERKAEFPGSNREGFAPSGQPSRRGRGSVRMRGGISRRMDGYGPPPAKSPFSHGTEKKQPPAGEKPTEAVADDKSMTEDEKNKQKQQVLSSSGSSTNIRAAGKTQLGSRMQKRSEHDPRSKASRGSHRHGNKSSYDQGDDAWETTSDNSEDEERKHDGRGSRRGYQGRAPYGRGEGPGSGGSGPRSGRSGPRSNSSSEKKFGGRETHSGKSINGRTSGGRSHNAQANSTQSESAISKEESKSEAGASVQAASAEKPKSAADSGSADQGNIPNEVDEHQIEEDNLFDTDFQEVRSKKKEGGSGGKDGAKVERRAREKPKEKRSKSSKDSSNQQQAATSSSTLTRPAPSTMSNYWLSLPPRLAKQRHNISMQQKQQSSEVAELNKLNHAMNMYPIKEGSAPPSVNAWEKPIRPSSPATNSSLQMPITASETLQSDNSSQRSSPHVPREAVDKALLDGSSPPMNTIIFENTNFKSTPNEIVMKTQFNNHMKQQRLEKGDRKLGEEPEAMLGFTASKSDLPAGASEDKSGESSMLHEKPEDSADMKLDFQFESELSQLTDDKSIKNVRDLNRSIQHSTISPSTADLNFKIAAAKKVWESMPTVMEHSEDGGNVATFTPNFTPDSTMDPSSYSKAVDGSVVVADDGNVIHTSEVVYSSGPQMQVNVNYTASKTDVSSTTSNVCKVKPQQQTVMSSGHSPIGHSGQSPLGHGGPISPPPYSTAQAGQFNYQQPGIGGTAAQYGGMSAIPSPPTVLYNSSTQIPPAYQTFQIDGTQVLSGQAARSQFSQFPPYGLSQGIGQTSAFSQQSVYLHQTAPPTAGPDIYSSSLSQYRLQPAAGPFGQSQLNNNPNTVLISSTANSLMSASVKPSTQPIGAIGTKGAAPFQQSTLPSAQHSQLYIPFDPVQLSVNQSYLSNSQIVQRGAPVQPSASSFYSGSAGAQAGFYQTPGSTLQQQAPGAPQLHQATGYSLQGFNSQSSATPVGLQSFGSQMGAQQFRTPGSVGPTTYLKSAVTPHHPTDLNLAPKSSTTSSQDVLASVFSSASQIPSPKSRPPKQISQQQQPPQQSPTQQTSNKFGSYQGSQSSSQLQQSGSQQRVSQTSMNLQSVRSGGGPSRYLGPIQRPVSYQHNNSRYRPSQPRPASSVKPYFGSQEGNMKLEESADLKTDESNQINCDAKITDSGTQSKTDGPDDDATKD